MPTQSIHDHTPIASVIIPCYNQGTFLEEAVTSVLNSSLKKLEIIVIDDGSTDNSLEIAISIQQRHPKLIQVLSQPNAGPSVARNLGIKQASGKYILPLDADDKIGQEYLLESVNKLEQNQNVKLVYCEAEKFGFKNKQWKLKEFSQAALAKDNMIFVSSVFRKSDWKNAGGFDERMVWGWEDWEFWINLLKSGGEVIKLPLVGFSYRIHSCSRRKSVNRKAKKSTIALINQKHSAFLNEHLGGPLRNPRTWSKSINLASSWFTAFQDYKFKRNLLPILFDKK
ncbi:galactosyltransferase-like protein [Algoriphagus ratkowskyi]|uniref:Galactosyltransferase-like protein n=1 Tax=Algoriphagus ratkowskyi TaxID=57028 RepID=A0A2W7RNG2_9BACT|nr:glycosyltransferase family A protein [Algoriphagus ratkowskyi]PZX57057.1 galactosyltransferase-like protein [Algoriphagus ratkowskyi]TXD79954.1 glycosyltransferase family 2 protein [Algoriphagus ratkowskyi]